jgi:hypothetical protein
MPPAPKPADELSPCGTWAAVMRHYRREEDLDDACREARNEHMRDLYWRKKDNLAERGIKQRARMNKKAHHPNALRKKR